MKKTKNYLFLSIAVIISLAISSCGKYEDGPGFSLLTKTARMTNKWELKSVDGIAVSGDEAYSMDLKKGGDASLSFLGGSLDGSWEFSSDKEDLILDFGFGNNPSKIMRLTNKELWLENELEDNELSKFEAQ